MLGYYICICLEDRSHAERSISHAVEYTYILCVVYLSALCIMARTISGYIPVHL